jgi:hypothetical protein
MSANVPTSVATKGIAVALQALTSGSAVGVAIQALADALHIAASPGGLEILARLAGVNTLTPELLAAAVAAAPPPLPPTSPEDPLKKEILGLVEDPPI